MRWTLRLLGVSLLAVVLAGPALGGTPRDAKGRASGEQEVAPVVTDASGKCELEFDRDLSEVEVEIKIRHIEDENVAGVHFHCGSAGSNGPILLPVMLNAGDPGPLGPPDGGEIEGELGNADILPGECGDLMINNIASFAYAVRNGDVYCNIHSVANPSGEVRAQMSE